MSQAPPPAGAQRPCISIIVPVLNDAAGLRRLLPRLQALAAPPGWDKEIIVGYTPSTDDTLAVIRKTGVHFVEAARRGPSAARNAAAAAARGQLFYFIDADAYPAADDLLVRLVEVALGAGRFGVLGGPVLLDPAQRRNPVAYADHLACWFLWTGGRPAGRSDFQPSVNLLMPRGVFQGLRGFDERLSVLEDFDVAWKAMSGGLPLYFHPALAVYHRARGTPWSSWRHSWHWGAPAREAFYARAARDRYRYVDDRARFWTNFPQLVWHRLRIMLRVGWRESPHRLLLCLPFLFATVFAWALAACVGTGPPRADR